MIHSIGHGVGLEVHELPRLSPKSRESISGSVLAIEPAFYKSYGMRFEETIHFDGKKVRIL
jgi:Xaa-Pro aminopeptidase